jgi:predicted AAA+ superfamily ATPase
MMKINDLTNDERIAMVEKLKINYPRMKEILERVEHCHHFSPKAAEPICMLVTGIQGVGKTTLYETYQKTYPRKELEHKTLVPTLSAVIPVPASVKGLVTELLLQLGDPIAEKGTVVSQTIRLRHLLKECETKCIFLDEFQHIIDRDSTKILQTTADWLKNLLNDTQIPVILIGMPSCQVILDANPQLRRRFSLKREIVPFKWVTAGSNINEMQLLLKVADSMLPLKKPSYLSDPETAYRIYCATAGLMSGIMKLIRGGSRIAIESGEERISLEILAQIYEEELAANYPEMPNPFLENFSQLKPIEINRLAQPGESFPMKSQKRSAVFGR